MYIEIRNSVKPMPKFMVIQANTLLDNAGYFQFSEKGFIVSA